MQDTSPGPRTLRVATRGSRLALAQVDLALAALREHQPDLAVDIVEISTQGDEDRVTPLSQIGGQGVFVAAVRSALLEDRADIAVHSLKDVPTTPADGLVLAAMLERGDPRDCLVSRKGATLAALPEGARVGTSSSRRMALLQALRPDLEIAEIRGNVDTRIQKVRDGDYDAAVLAAAGLARLDRIAEASQLFEANAFLPSPGQGVITIECRADDAETRALLEDLDHRGTRVAAEAERGVLAALGTGCELPVGAYARIEDNLLLLRAFVGNEVQGTPIFGDATGPLDGAETLGRGLGTQLLQLTTAATGDAP